MRCVLHCFGFLIRGQVRPVLLRTVYWLRNSQTVYVVLGDVLSHLLVRIGLMDFSYKILVLFFCSWFLKCWWRGPGSTFLCINSNIQMFKCDAEKNREIEEKAFIQSTFFSLHAKYYTMHVTEFFCLNRKFDNLLLLLLLYSNMWPNEAFWINLNDMFLFFLLILVVIVVVAAGWCCRNNWSLASAFSSVHGCLMAILRFCALPEYWMC